VQHRGQRATERGHAHPGREVAHEQRRPDDVEDPQPHPRALAQTHRDGQAPGTKRHQGDRGRVDDGDTSVDDRGEATPQDQDQQQNDRANGNTVQLDHHGLFW